MHSTGVGSVGVPAFLVKLWKLVEDPNYDDLICWNSNGTSFFIRDHPRFSRELLPLYFKHSNMASFIRQLNMYGFRKVVGIESGGLRMEKDEMEFEHVYFRKENVNLLEHIKRKVPTVKSTPREDEAAKSQPDIVTKVINDVNSLHGKQENLDLKLDKMKRENEALWREIAGLRQQHIKQKQIIEKLIQFFLSIVQPNRGMGVSMRRKTPLMLDSTAHLEPKRNRLSRNISFESGSGSGSDVQKPSIATQSAIPAVGPVIHEITDCVDVDTFLDSGSELALLLPNDEAISSSSLVEPIVNSPGPSSVSSVKADDGQFSNIEPEPPVSAIITDAAALEAVPAVVASSSSKPSNLDDLFKEIDSSYLAMPSSSKETTSKSVNPTSNSLRKTSNASRMDFLEQFDAVNMEIEALKELFTSGDYMIDASTVMRLFSNDDIISNKGLSDIGDYGKLPSGNEIVGNEVTQFYNGPFELDESDPNLFSHENFNGDAAALPLGQEGLFEIADAVALDESNQETADAVPSLSTDLALNADLDFLMDPSSLLTEDGRISPGRRKENTCTSETDVVEEGSDSVKYQTHDLR